MYIYGEGHADILISALFSRKIIGPLPMTPNPTGIQRWNFCLLACVKKVCILDPKKLKSEAMRTQNVS